MLLNPSVHSSLSKRPKILVVDDHSLTRITLCRALNYMNYTTVEACNGYVGLKLFKREKPDVVVTDILMPDKGGLQTILELRAINPHVTIVAMSGGGARHDRSFLELAKDLGATLTISKPFRPAEMYALLNTLNTKGEA